MVGLSNAISDWAMACGVNIPSFITFGTWTFTLTVVIHDEESPTDPNEPDYCEQRCGCFNAPQHTMHIFTSAPGVSNCRNFSRPLFEHELGHVLGLDDAIGCSGHLMGDTLSSSLTVTSAECSAVNFLWLTPDELNDAPPDDHPCTKQQV
jgi:hypothetical protein